MSPAGYSGRPLSKKLGITDGSLVCVVGDGPDLSTLLDPLPNGVALGAGLADHPDVVLFFTTDRTELEDWIPRLARVIHPDSAAWICWPKRASRFATDVTEDVVREVALPLGLVDNKVAAIDATWSGLRLVWRRERR